MKRQRYNLNREGKSLKKARSFFSNPNATSKAVESRTFNLRQMRDEMSEGHLLAQKRRGEEEDDQAREKVRRLEVPSEFQAGAYDREAMGPTFSVGDILDGNIVLPASHAGEEFLDILHDESSDNETTKSSKRRETSKRRERVERRNAAFNAQLSLMIDAYMRWDAGLGEGGLDNGAPVSTSEAGLQLRVIDVFRCFSLQTGIEDGPQGIAASLVEMGLIPCAPFHPSVAISTRLMKLFDTLHLQSPHLSAQSFVKGLCDLHDVPYQPYLLRQFIISYDVYLQIKNGVHSRVCAALKREGNWRLRNACLACTYKLYGEDQLVFDMLVTMDGNDSLKRVLCRETSYTPEDGQPVYRSVERPDTRCVSGDYYLSRERVDRWAKTQAQQTLSGVEDDDNPCASRWSNMVNELTARMWAVFDETGIFLALCRHGFALVVVDMVRSGEMAKYPLAVVEALLDAFGAKIGGGYDIGCKFKTTLANSALGERARTLEYTALVGSFHGHAHNRLCQLSHLATYVKGMGLEDLEGCERFFSKSNALAASTRHASAFHRQQNIAEYLKYTDSMETSQNLSEFIVRNYRQALDIIAGEGELEAKMKNRGITGRHVFEQWLEEEQKYLRGLAQEPVEETTAMEYYQSLVDLKASEAKVYEIRNQFVTYSGPAPALQPSAKRSTGKKLSPATQLRHAEDHYKREMERVHVLEQNLGLESNRWTEASPEYQQAAVLVSRRRYQRCLDELEALVVSRVFELTKMNMSHTGYKLRKHIAKALRSRSQALATALKKYNTAASAMTPKAPTLTWDQVVEYAFLSDFDLLRDSRQDVRQRPWAEPANRVLMNTHFKIVRAHEEIQRLNIEIRRVITFLRDEDAFLVAKEAEVAVVDPLLAHQINQYYRLRTRFDAVHLGRFQKLANTAGFSGSISPGVGVDTSLREVLTQQQQQISKPQDHPGEADGSTESDDEDLDNEAQVDNLEALIAVSY